MNSHWIKLYIEILDDPKMGRLPDWLWRRTIELFLLAGENRNDGELPPVSDIAWRLRLDEAKLSEALRALSQVRVVELLPDGKTWKIVNFERRQAAVSSTDRVRKHRVERKRNETFHGMKRDETDTDTESDTESDTKTETEKKQRRSSFSPARALSIWTEITGQFAFPGSERSEIEPAMEGLIAQHGDKIIDYLRPFWNAWANECKYSKTNGAWLYDCAVTGQVPARRNGKGARNDRDVALAALDKMEE